MDETAGANGTWPPRTVPTPTTVRLLGVPSIAEAGNELCVPEGCKRLVAFVALPAGARRALVRRRHAVARRR